MILFIIFILIVVGAYLIARLVDLDPGYALFAYNGHVFEMSLWKALLLLLVFLFVLYIAWRLIKVLLSTGSFFGRWNYQRQKKAAQTKFFHGIQAYFEGDWKKASKALIASAKKSNIPGMHYLMAARATHAGGDYETAQNLLEKAQQEAGVDNVAVLLSKAEVFLEKGAYQSCIELCQDMLKKQPKHIAANRLLADAYLEMEDWVSLETVLPNLLKQKIILPEEASFYEEQIVLDKIVRAEETGLEGLISSWKSIPNKVKNNSKIVSEYVTRLIGFSNMDEAEKELATALKQNWDDELVRLYGLVKSSDISKQLKQVNTWATQEKNASANLFLTAGRIALMNQLWGKAEMWFEKSVEMAPNKAAYIELSRLSSNLGDNNKALNHFQRWLDQESMQLPDLPQPSANT